MYMTGRFSPMFSKRLMPNILKQNKTPAICREIIEAEKAPIMPYKRPMTQKGYFKKYEYVYDEHYDYYICPNNQILSYSTTNRNGYREYKSVPKICCSCPKRMQCRARTLLKLLPAIFGNHNWRKQRIYVALNEAKNYIECVGKPLNWFLPMLKKNRACAISGYEA